VSEAETIKVLMTTGGGAGGLIAILLILRRLWSEFSATRVSTIQDGAQVSVIETLRLEVERLSQAQQRLEQRHKDDIESIKREHASEREELMKRIHGLETRIADLQDRHHGVKKEALEAYMLLGEGVGSPGVVEELKQRLMAIILSVDEEVKA
jgi:uncharacterized protein YlxW (UPF0749 family)